MEQDRLEIIAAMNTKIIKSGIDQTIASLKNLEMSTARVNARFNEIGQLKGFSVTSNNIKKVNNDTKMLGSNLNKASKIITQGFNLGKLYLLWNITKRIRQTIIGWVDASIDYIETTNKFEVAMRDMSGAAYDFQNKLANAFGTVTTEMMNFQATFKNIMSSLPRSN